MKTRGCWPAALVGLLLFAGGAAPPEPAAEALKKGNACIEKEDFDAAIVAFSEAIRLDPKSAQAYAGRGRADRKSVV